MKILYCLSGFPEISEVFICSEMAGMLDRGHTIRIAATHRVSSPHHQIVGDYQFLDQCWFLSEALSHQNSQSPFDLLEECMSSAHVSVLVEQIKTNWMWQPVIEPLIGSRSHRHQSELLVLIYALLINLISREQPDIISCQFGQIGAFVSPLRPWIQAPIVTYFRGQDFSTAPNNQLPLSQLFEKGDHFLANSEYTRSSVIALGCNPEKITTVGSAGVDPQAFTFKTRHWTEPLRLLTVARLVEKKGLEYAIRGVANVIKNTQYNIHYDIIGDGPLRNVLETLINDLDVGSQIHLLGSQPHQQVAAHMSQVHLSLLTSVVASDGETEGLGGALLEAQMAGIPVLATRHNGFSDAVVDHKSGFLVPERDSAAIEERLLFLLEHPSLWPQMGRCGHEHVMKHFTRKAVTDKIEQVFKVLAGS